jgi:hypothetical protein
VQKAEKRKKTIKSITWPKINGEFKTEQCCMLQLLLVNTGSFPSSKHMRFSFSQVLIPFVKCGRIQCSSNRSIPVTTPLFHTDSKTWIRTQSQTYTPICCRTHAISRHQITESLNTMPSRLPADPCFAQRSQLHHFSGTST